MNGEDIKVDNIKKKISSKKNSILEDEDGNQIFLEKFEYSLNENLFKSLGFIRIKDKKSNVYEFSQIYIDTKKIGML